MSDSESTDGEGFDAQKMVEEREGTSITSNPTLLARYVGYALIGAFVFALLGAMLNFRLLPLQYPALGTLTIGGAVGFGAANERNLPLPKRALSTFGYLAFTYLGGMFFPPPGIRLRSSVFTVAILIGMLGGAFIWYYLRNQILASAFE